MPSQSLKERILKLDELIYDAAINADRWKNLYFLKTGETVMGDTVFNTEKEGADHFTDLVLNYRIMCLSPDIEIPTKSLHYAIQVPHKE